MISIDQLVLNTGFSEKQLWFFANNSYRFYYSSEKPKTKFGEKQRDHLGIKMRPVEPSFGPLKQVQKEIGRLLQNIPMPDYVFGSIKNKSNVLNALQHIDNKYFFRVDLNSYFSRITHLQVYNMFKELGFPSNMPSLLTKVTTVRNCLQQGPPTSPVIANLVFLNTGNKIMELIKGHGITFTTYLDDLVFSSKSDFKFLTQTILSIIKGNGFYLNQKKIYYQTNMTEVTGIFLHNGQFAFFPGMVERAKTNSQTAAYIKYAEKCFVEYMKRKKIDLSTL